MTKRTAKIDWTQAKANASGRDFGLEGNALFKEFVVFGLPQKANRRGFELRCEVVHPEALAACQPGHGPCA